MAVPFLGDHPVELGSELADDAQGWLAGGIPELTLTEVDPSRLAILKDKFASEPRVHIEPLNIFEPPAAAYSALVAVNVLEHIPDQFTALRAAHRLVRPGAAAVMFVPAFEFAICRFDRAVGHVRRYTVRSMTAAMEQADLTVELARNVHQHSGLCGVVREHAVAADDTGWRAPAHVVGQPVIRRTRRWEANHAAPFGQSVFAVARVPA